MKYECFFAKEFHYRQSYTMHDRLLGITEYFLLCAVGYAAAMFLSCHTLTCKNHFGFAYVKLTFYLHFEGKNFLRAFVIALNFSANCFSRKRTQWLECKIGYIFYKRYFACLNYYQSNIDEFFI